MNHMIIPKISRRSPNCGGMKGLEIYDYISPLGTNIYIYIYEIYDSKDNTH
jgi:hypothetical protein